MDLLKTAPFQLIFRGIFPGCFFVISYLVHKAGGWKHLGKVDYSDWLPAAILVGVTAYILHRSLVYIWIEMIFDCAEVVRSARKPTWNLLIKNWTKARLLDMWSTGENKEPYQNIAKHMTAWNDYIQTQYVSAECIIAGFLFHNGLSRPSYSDRALLSLAAFFVIGGILSEHRFRIVSRMALALYPVKSWWPPKQNQPDSNSQNQSGDS